MGTCLFNATFDSTLEDLLPNVQAAGFGTKEWIELSEIFQSLTMWRDVFQTQYGALQSLVHQTPPNDPPDAVATFERATVHIEHTMIEPENWQQASAIHQRQTSPGFSFPPPASLPPKNAKALKKIMYSGSMPMEACSEEAWAFYELATNAITEKFEKPKLATGGILVLSGKQIFCNDSFRPALELAFATARQHMQGHLWTIAFLSAPNPLHLTGCISVAPRWREIRGDDVSDL